MTTAAPTHPERQADALVRDIRRQLGSREQELLAAADREAREIRAKARDKARRQARRAIEELRAAERERTQQLLAELETARRRRTSALAQRSLALAWPQLAEALRRRWHDDAARPRWMRAQIDLARTRLPACGWLLRHPQAWRDDDRAELLALLQQSGITNATLQPDSTLTAGLVIEADGGRLDSTPAALMADRPRVEAALLAALAIDEP